MVDGDKERDREVERRRQEAQVLDTYKRRVLALERELKLVRMSSGRASTPTSASRQQTVRSSSPVVRNNASRYSSQQSTPPNTSRGRGSRPSSSSHSVTNSWGSHTSSTPNYSPSSSLGRRFDPTAYTKHKHQQHATTPGSHSNTSASRASRRYMDSPESGYSSAGSRTSQNSRRSQNSQNSQKLRANAQIRKAATHTRDPVPASAGKTQGSVRGGGGGSSSGGRKSTTSAVKAHIRGGGLDRGSDRGSDRDSDREDRVSHSKSKSQRSARDREVMQEAVPMKSKSHKPQSDISSNRRRRDAGGGRGGADSSAGEEEEEEMEDREVLLARRRSAQQSQSSAVHSNQHHQNGHKMRFEEDIGDDEEEDRDVLRGGGGGVLRRSADRNTGSSNSNNSQAQPQQLLTNSQTLLRRSAERSAPHTYPNNNSAASAAGTTMNVPCSLHDGEYFILFICALFVLACAEPLFYFCRFPLVPSLGLYCACHIQRARRRSWRRSGRPGRDRQTHPGAAALPRLRQVHTHVLEHSLCFFLVSLISVVSIYPVERASCVRDIAEEI